MLLRHLLPSTLVLAGLACGARTQLPVPDGEGGTTSTTTNGPSSIASTSSASQGGGGEGGGSGGQGGGGGPPIEECDPSILFIYLVTSETDLYRFDPATLTFTRVGSLACPTSGSPFSMAVSRSGRAYSVYNTGELFRINVKTAACSDTAWSPLGGDFGVFGMGYAIDDDGQDESLYVADISFEDPSAGLARLDTTSFDLDFRGPFSQNPGNAIELTSSDDGELYGYFLNNPGPGGTLVRIDKETAEILETVALPPPSSSSSSLAFAYWNGDFYIFTGGSGFSEVTRYRPSDGSVGVVATLDRDIVGAGVTTCDPDAGTP